MADDLRRFVYRTTFSREEFARRRGAVMDAIGGDGVAIVPGAPSAGDLALFRQDNDFFYLCGVEVAGAHLLLDTKTGTSTVYLPPRDEGEERSEGPRLHADDADAACAWTGVERVAPLASLVDDIPTGGALYVPRAEASRAHVDEFIWSRAEWPQWFARQLSEHTGIDELEDLTPTLRELRMVKSAEEIDVMRFAGRLTALAATEGMRSTAPGVMEYQLGAVADYIYRVNGARGGGYPAIIGGGTNAWFGHYWRNNDELRDGDMLLLDYAPDYEQYTSDIGRMWPVNGTYSPAQRELYGFIVEYHKTLLSLIGPGELAAEIMDRAAETMGAVIDSTAWSQPHYEAAARGALTFRGHLSHTVGLDVHDSGNYWPEPLKPGTVFSVDPMIWIPEERLYVRVEDTIAITEDGIENFTALAPLELDDVEACMREPGMIQAYPPERGGR
ncbi:M24 family metallopeptidase [Candidatus Poribacteria bacterium]|nr:M24 family metallopeptidase [Candidatus Poribacteria bacterium]MBT5534477.1 M24 family metallopeptidase [Candidatus Poribacteria bacterium]MBT5711268.1 M24 family metallopeptidase [Candidatus Poribacteria bacterium]MBT7098475.1 M24 family metallopeptidase [Candidatus Poribacteria bacterium]MBT7808922.1 M24 family metallopeptidase [Candidatus Poribacteria bacterium]